MFYNMQSDIYTTLESFDNSSWIYSNDLSDAFLKCDFKLSSTIRMSRGVK